MSNKKLHYKVGVQLDCVDDFSQLKLLANQHHAVLIDNINFRSAAEFEQWTSLFASIDTTNNQSLDYQGMGLRNNNILTISQTTESIPPGGMPYLNTAGSGAWHQDRPHRIRNSNSFTIICSHLLPEIGGNTILAGLGAAWDDLSDCFQNILKNLKTQNVNRAPNLWTHAQIVDHRDIFEQEINVPIMEQSLVVTDATGRLTLNFSPKNCVGISGMHGEESDPIIKFLTQHISKPEYQYRHNWQKGQVLVFSNLHVCHYGVRDYYDQPRELWQVIVDL
jgi:alpha-ketoglutarate-dependent taurine dioxygenase